MKRRLLSFAISVSMFFSLIGMDAYATEIEENVGSIALYEENNSTEETTVDETDEGTVELLSTTTGEEVGSGECGDNVNYAIYDTDGDSTGDYVEITGTGKMSDYRYSSQSPFGDHTNIVTIYIDDGVTDIGNYIFAGCSSLSSITIPDSVTSIGDYAFSGCSSLSSITIPDSVTSIGKGAFGSCNISSITIPDSVTTIGESAFYACKKLDDITIPDSVTSLSPSIFYHCDSLESIVIPNSITNIGHDAFSYCVSLTDITIPDSVTSIDSSAFYYCSSLENVTIGNGVLKIYSCAFYACKKLSNVTIGSNVASIGGQAFDYCTSLTSIIIPDSVKVIDYNVFSSCSNLKCIYVNEPICQFYKNVNLGTSWKKDNVAVISTVQGEHSYEESKKTQGTATTKGRIEYICSECGYKYELKYFKDENKSTFAGYDGLPSGNVPIIPSMIDGGKVVAISNYALSDYSYLTRITIPDSVTRIGDSAFYNCSSLTDITIPDGVTSIDDSAFYNCSSLTDIIIPDGVTSIGYKEFYGCSSLTDITIPANVISIGSYAFYGCSSLTDITIPASVTSIGSYAFGACNGLKSIYIPASVTKMEERCVGLIQNDTDSSYEIVPDLTIYGDKDSRAEIYANAYGIPFRACPPSAYTISYELDGGINNENNPGYYYLDRTLVLGNPTKTGYTFEGWYTDALFENEITEISTNMGDITLYAKWEQAYSATGSCGTNVSYYTYDKDGDRRDDYVEIVGTGKMTDFGTNGSPFYYNTDIKEVKIYDGVTSIGSNTFRYCTGLTKITIPDSITSIGDSAFSDCKYLSGITIGNKITSIGASAFYNCGSLRSITIPDSVKSLGNYAFYGCNSLADITIGKGVTSIGYSVFNGCSSLTDIIIGGRVTSIGSYSFNNCSKLISITIPDSVTSIGYYAFTNCSSLTEITIPASVKTIDDRAFSGCSGLTNIVIGSGVTKIGSYAFSGCSGLTNIAIGSGVSSIGSYAFSSCSKLISITIPNSVSSIGSYAFYGCKKLEVINVDVSICQFYKVVSLGSSWKENNIPVISSVSTEHSFEETIKTQGTATTKGSAEYTCSECGYKYTLYYYKDGDECKLAGCSGLPSDNILAIPEEIDGGKVVSIKEYAFNSGVLRGLIIPDSVTSIGSSAFSGNSSLAEVTIGNGITSIGSAAFTNCSSLKCIYINVPVCQFYKNNGLSSYWKSDNTAVVFTASGEHSVCENIKTQGTATTKGSVEYLCSECGYRYVLQYYKDGDKCTIAGYSGLPSDNILVIPDEIDGGIVDAISDSAFSNCSMLAGITIPDSVTSIGDSAFSGCSSLTEITIPDSVRSIGSSGFSGCSSLTGITIPDSVTSIGDSAFSGCSSLAEITIPDSVTNIGNSAFSGCSSLTEITIPDSVTNIGYSAFSFCSSLTEITIPDSVTSIGDCAFYNCSSLNGITIPDSVTSIGNCAFSGCSSLNGITIPDSVTNIGDSAFSGCSSLTKITIPNSVTNIGNYTFEYCNRLKSIDIPSSVTSMGANCVGMYYNSTAKSYKPIIDFVINGYKGSEAENYANTNGITFNISAQPALFTLEAYQVLLDGGFDLKYILKLSDAVLDDDNSYMEFTINESKQIAKPLFNDEGEAIYYCSVGAKNLGDKITAKLYTGGELYDISEYSIKECMEVYITNKDNNERYAAIKDLAKAILNYGSYCQKFFAYDTDNLVNKNLYTTENNPINDISDSSIIDQIKDDVTITNNNSDFTYIGSSLTCMNNTYLNMYFCSTAEITEEDINEKYIISTTGVNKSDVEYKSENGILRITVKNIPAAELDNSINFDIKSFDGSLNVEYCPLVYIKKVLSNNEANQDLKNLCKALYLYNQEANKYFD